MWGATGSAQQAGLTLLHPLGGLFIGEGQLQYSHVCLGGAHDLQPHGQPCFVEACRHVPSGRALQRELALIQHEDAGSLRLGLSSTPAAVLLHPCMVALLSEYPRLRVDAVIGRTLELIDGLRRERYDMVVLAAVRRDIDVGDLVPLGLFSPSLSGHYALVRLSGRTQLPALDIVYGLARRLCTA